MSTLIVSTFPDCGRYNPIKLNSKFVNIYMNRHRKIKGSNELNPDFPNNYLDVVRKCVGKFEVVLVSSNPVIRHQLCSEFPAQTVVIYPKAEALEKLTAVVKEQGSEKDEQYIQSVTKNWDRWHKEAELFCIENNIPYYEVSSTEEANELIEKLSSEQQK